MRSSTFFFSTIFLTIAQSGSSEIVHTTDGRIIDLSNDGTYEIIDSQSQADDQFVEYKEHYFIRHEGEYGRNSVRFMPIFENISDKKIMGIKFNAQFLSVFGDEIFQFSGETNEPITSGATSTHGLFYFFEDNQFMSNQPYDLLLPMVINESGTIDVTLEMIAFEGGEIINFPE